MAVAKALVARNLDRGEMREMLIYPRRAWVIAHLGAEQARDPSVRRVFAASSESVAERGQNAAARGP
jgi:hypothetical protein